MRSANTERLDPRLKSVGLYQLPAADRRNCSDLAISPTYWEAILHRPKSSIGSFLVMSRTKIAPVNMLSNRDRKSAIPAYRSLRVDPDALNGHCTHVSLRRFCGCANMGT